MRPASFALLAFVWTTILSSAVGQSSDSHIKLPGTIDRGAAEKRMADRFMSSSVKTPLGLLEQMLKNPERYGLTKDKIEQMAKEFGKRPQDLGVDLNDPKFRDMAKRMAEQAKLTPEDIERLRRVMPDIKPPDVKPPDVKPPADKPPDIKPPADKPPDIKPPADRMPPDRPPVDKPPMDRPPPDRPGSGPMGRQPPRPDDVIKPETPRKPRSSRSSSSNNWIGEQLRNLRSKSGFDLRDRMRSWIGSRGFVGDLTRGVSSETRRLTRSMLPSLDGIRPDRFLRDLSPRNTGLPTPRFDLKVDRPSFGAPSMSGEGGGNVLLLVVLLGCLGLAFFFLFRSRLLPALKKAGGWRIGPWPVSPDAVRTREEIVKAFEYLAFLRLGREAGSANHRDIGKQLGGNDARRRNAADELASLYEHVRYAPERDDLPPEEIEAARRNLRLLAGAPTA